MAACSCTWRSYSKSSKQMRTRGAQRKNGGWKRVKRIFEGACAQQPLLVVRAAAVVHAVSHSLELEKEAEERRYVELKEQGRQATAAYTIQQAFRNAYIRALAAGRVKRVLVRDATRCCAVASIMCCCCCCFCWCVWSDTDEGGHCHGVWCAASCWHRRHGSTTQNSSHAVASAARDATRTPTPSTSICGLQARA